MLVKHYARGKFYRIACPSGSRVVRRPAGDCLLVPFEGDEVHVPVDPPELLPLLAESGRCGLALVGPPSPDARLVGASCPRCGRGDVDWLSLEDDAGRIHCDSCGADFAPRSGDSGANRPADALRIEQG